MRRKRLLWQLYVSYVLITLASLAAVIWYVSDALRQFDLDQTSASLEIMAALLEDQVRTEILAAQPPEGAPGYLDALRSRVDPLCKRLGKRTSTRITVVLPDGTVVGDTDEKPANMDNHHDRKEIREALMGGPGKSLRYSDTLKEDRDYVAVAVRSGATILGVVRTSIPLRAVDDHLRRMQWQIALGSLMVAALMAAVTLLISQRISRPLEELKRGAERFARGDFQHRLPTSDSREIGALAETLNQMAADLSDRMRALVEQRNERDAILSSMVEGVLAVDLQERLISLNEAGGRLIGVDAAKAQGRSLPEVIRHPELQKLVAAVLTTLEAKEEELVLYDNEDRFLEAHATVLRDAAGNAMGVLVVLHDITRIKRLESLRRDFVANVSHELKTPVTSIQGFVETLLDGAMHNAEDTERFLRIVTAQTQRLGAIIDDLLDLSRIEKEEQRAEVVLTQGPIQGVLRSAIELCRSKAAEKDIALELDCPDDLEASVNSLLLEEAVVNLVDNAIKYSPNGRPIRVEAARGDREVVIRVSDQGCGIGPEHLPRIFERFYRVDKARSRKLGGTGLGLAIVKHIAQAHGGRATVESTLGAGSVFTIHLPG